MIVGPRALGMGGAYTAIGKTSLGGYWNPGALGLQTGFDLKINAGGGAEFTGNILDSANNIIKFADEYSKLKQSQKSGGGMDIKQLSAVSKAIKNLRAVGQPGNGVVMNVGGGMGIRSGKYAITVTNYQLIGTRPYTEVNGFYLGSGTFSMPTTGSRVKSAFAGDDDYAGVSIDTAMAYTPTNPNLLDDRDRIQDEIVWIRESLEKAGVSIPISNADLANVLINTAVEGGATEADIAEAVTTVIDNRELLELVLGSADPNNSFATNQSNLTVRGLSVTEIGLSSSWPLTYVENLHVGGTVKMMMGQTGYFRQMLFTETAGEDKEIGVGDAVEDMSKNMKGSSQIGLDLGLYYNKMEEWSSTFGLVLKNINSPKFDMPEEGIRYGETNITLDPQIRVGAAYYPLDWISISTDYDLTSNATLIPSYNSQYFAIGTEINLGNQSYFNIPLRFGMMKNMAAQQDTSAYTGGIGINLGHVLLDLSGAMSANETKIDATTSMPANAYAQLGLSLEF